mgnify:CR=1 FL=1
MGPEARRLFADAEALLDEVWWATSQGDRHQARVTAARLAHEVRGLRLPGMRAMRAVDAAQRIRTLVVLAALLRNLRLPGLPILAANNRHGIGDRLYDIGPVLERLSQFHRPPHAPRRMVDDPKCVGGLLSFIPTQHPQPLRQRASRVVEEKIL